MSNRSDTYRIRARETIIFIPPRIAALIDSRTNLTALRVQIRGLDPDASAVLESIHESALSWRGFPKTTTDLDQKRQPAPPSEVLTTGQAAKEAGVSRQAIGQAIAAGRLHATKPGGRWEIHRTDLQQWQAIRPTNQ